MEQPTAAAMNVNTGDTEQQAVPHRPIPLLVEVKSEPSDKEDRVPENSGFGNGVESREDESRGTVATVSGAQAMAEGATCAVEEPPITAEATTRPVAAEETAATQETTTPVAAKQTVATAAAAEVPLPCVKAEPVVAEQAETDVPDSFFDDLLQTADEIQAVVCPSNDGGESNIAHAPVKLERADVVTNDGANGDLPAVAPTPMATGEEAIGDAADEEPIPQNFFDDLLVDRVAERLVSVENQELELKYSDRLRELQRLEEKERKKAHKKKKKKSHKRSRSGSGERSGHKRRRQSHSQSPKRDSEVPRLRVRQGLDADEVGSSQQRTGSLFPHTPAGSQEQPSTSAERRSRLPLRVKSEFSAQVFGAEPGAPSDIINVDELCLPVQQTERFPRRNMNGLILDDATPLGFRRIKLEKDSNEWLPVSVEAPLEALTPTEKLKRATRRAITVIEEFKKLHQTPDAPLSSFIYTSTVRKLPSNLSYVTQQIYDNRSPLHTVNNVSYKFSSHATQFNLHEWGLEALPSHAAKVAKILGYDAHTLSSKLQTFKLPPKLQRVKREQNAEAVDEVRSTFYTNAMTQTDDVTVLAGRQRGGYDIGVQTQLSCNSVAVQTKNSGPNAADAFASDELPLMQQLKQLNEYQLLALSDFAELIREPQGTDVYRLRLRMLEIYKCSQMSSAVPLQPPLAGPYSGQEPCYEPTPPQQQRLRRDPRQHQPPPQEYARAAAMLPHYQAAAQPPPRPQTSMPYQSHAPLDRSVGHPPLTHQPTLIYPQTLTHEPTLAQHMPQNGPHHTPHPGVPHAATSKFYGRGGMRR